MSRRQGHIEERGGGAFRLVVEGPPDPVSGARRQRSRTVHVRGLREAEHALARFVLEIRGQGQATEARTVKELCDDWLAHAGPSMQPNTLMEFEASLRRYVWPRLGQVPIGKVTAWDLDRLYKELAESGGKGGRPLAPATIRKAHTAVRLAFDQAINWRWLAENPARHAKPPRVGRKDPQPPDPAEMRRLMDLVDAKYPEWQVYLRLAASSGARRAELCALRWSAVDLDKGTVTVRAAVVVGPDGPFVRPHAKTSAGMRTFKVGTTTIAALRAHHAWQQATAAKLGVALAHDPFLFSTKPDGSVPWHPQNVTHRFSRLRDRAGVPHVHVHSVRHYVASQLLASGADVVKVAGRLGHANKAVTLNTYSHWVPASDGTNADLLDDLLDTN